MTSGFCLMYVLAVFSCSFMVGFCRQETIAHVFSWRQTHLEPQKNSLRGKLGWFRECYLAKWLDRYRVLHDIRINFTLVGKYMVIFWSNCRTQFQESFQVPGFTTGAKKYHEKLTLPTATVIVNNPQKLPEENNPFLRFWQSSMNLYRINLVGGFNPFE